MSKVGIVMGSDSDLPIVEKAINCLNPHDGNPCNECENCKLINSWKTTDYVEIDAASNTWVDNVREVIIDQAWYQPMSLKKKIYVIDEVHMLSTAAFNALLKTIEEPDWNVCFILATTELQKVPQTIISRVQIFNFKKIPQDEMAKHLADICSKEWFEYEDEALNLIATISEWCVRDAIKYLDQVSVLWKISTWNVSQFLWISTDSTIRSFFDTVRTSNINQIFEQIDQLAQWTDWQQFAKQCLWFIDAHVLEDVNFYLQISEVFSEILKQIRFYPYPTVLYKMAFNKYLWNFWESTPISKPTQKQEPKIEIKPEENDVEKEPTLKSEEQQEPNNSTWNLSNNEMWESIIKQIQSSTLQWILKEHMMIDSINDTTVTLIFDNNMIAKTMFDKEQTTIEWAFEKQLWRKVSIELKWMSKEEYFKKLMNN